MAAMAGEPQRTPRSGAASPRYGILGGTFDPPHIAHLIVAQEALTRLDLDRVYFVPAGQPPHKQDLPISSAADRRALVECAIAGNRRFALSTVDLDREGPSFTVETLQRLRAGWGSRVALDLIIGWDMLVDLPMWHDPVGVVREATHVVAVHRPGYDEAPGALDHVLDRLPDLSSKLILLPVPQLAISASELRARVASSLPIRYFVPERVRRYIADRGLYRFAGVPHGSLSGARSVHANQEAASGTLGRWPPAAEQASHEEVSP